MNYRVVWEIDIEADSFEEAAREADSIMRDPEALPPIFDITDENGVTERVDVEDLA